MTLFIICYFIQVPEWSVRTTFPVTTVGQPAYVFVSGSFNVFIFNSIVLVVFLFYRFVQPAKFDGGADLYVVTILAQVNNDGFVNALSVCIIRII